MPLKDLQKAIGVPNILLPRKSIDLTKWAIVACDQFTSQPSYWKELKKFIGDEPSTFEMVLPEVYLEKMNDEYIKKINQTMIDYLNHFVFEDIGPSMMLIERMTSINNRRLGLLMTIDLEAYDYQDGSRPLIRTTEKTILNRIPPRVKIRENAPLELSHVMLLVDDPKLHIIENLYERRHEFTKKYDFVLNMFGGRQLQAEYYITVDGNERKVSAKGELYGWPVIRYRLVVDWAPADWLEGVKDWPAAEARELILDDGAAMSNEVDRQKLAKKLGWR